MLVRELLATVAKMVESSELAQAITNKTEKNDAVFKEKTDKLLACFNSVQTDIAVNYLAPTARKDLTEKSTSLDDISVGLIRVVGVYTKDGYAVNFDIVGDRLVVREKDCYAVYEYIPSDSAIDGEFYYKDKIIGARAFAYGVCSEYCLLEMSIEESFNWESKYRQAVEIRTDYRKRRLKREKDGDCKKIKGKIT